MQSSPLIAIVGPTAASKSALALRLARTYQGEIVSADSRQVYRHMDIGTAKPTEQERTEVPFHLVDILNPNQPYSLEIFLRSATQSINSIHSRHSMPFIVGGTGQYMWALLEGWKLPQSKPDPELRAQLEKKANEYGPQWLHQSLQQVDYDTACAIDPNNTRRVIRALEIYHTTYATPSKQRTKGPNPYETLIIGLTMDRKELYQRIDHRVDHMMEMGLLEEVQALLHAGYDTHLPAMSSFGYREIILHLTGQLTLEEAVAKIKYNTHRFARRQYAWYSLKDPRIKWLIVNDDTEAQAQALVERFLRKQGKYDKMNPKTQQ